MRWLVAVAVALMTLSLAPAAHARCASLTVDDELAASRYVFEGAIESIEDRVVTLRVRAVWQGTPPALVRVTGSGRASIGTIGHVGQSWLVFAQGEADALHVSRCGNSAPLDLEMARVTLASLHARGRTRISPWHPPR